MPDGNGRDAATAEALHLHLPVPLREQIVAHARAEAPRECCGLVAGRDGLATRLFPLTNVEPGTTRYRIDDGEVYRLYREIEDRGEEIVAIYHSHPVTPAYPSPTDVALAFWPEAFYVICSLADGDRPVIRAFRIADGRIDEAAIRP